jgi:CRISPR system Cascade subunit CasE
MYYISRVELNTINRQKMRDLTHLGAYHSWVEKSFPDEMESGERSRKLWRIDTLNDKKYLLVVSKTPPDLNLLEYYGVEKTAKTKNYDVFLDKLYNGQKLSFRLVANPVVSVCQAGKRGKVFPHITASQQLEYFEKHSEKWGFSLVDNNYQIIQRDFPLLRKKGGQSVKLVSASYEGVLTIIDVATFKKTLTEGVGREKAYGFGLMTVIQLR